MLMVDDRNFFQNYEIIGGEKIMAPAAPIDHSGIISRMLVTIANYTITNKCGYVFPDDTDVHFPDGNVFSPDLVVITKENAGIMNLRGAIHGVPDMVVEVLSRSTRKRDIGVKKDTYEKNGVREYWIVDPWAKIVDVYILREGKYFLDGEYHKYSDEEFAELPDEDKAEVKTEIKLSIFKDCVVKLDEIFDWFF